jgi:hypothetical protein
MPAMRNRCSSSLPLRVQSTVALPVCNTPARAPQRDQNRTRPSLHNHKGIESWFITGDTNDPESSETVAQIGWFQVLQGYQKIGPQARSLLSKPKEKRQEGLYRKQWTKELIEFFWTHGNTLERSVRWHMPLTKTARALQRSLTTSGSTPSSNGTRTLR